MTNRKHFGDGVRLAQLVEHQTFNLRSICSSPISGSNGIPYVCTLYGNNTFLFMPIENVHHLSNFFQLMPVLEIHACSNPSPLTKSMQLYFRNYMKYSYRLLS